MQYSHTTKEEAIRRMTPPNSQDLKTVSESMGIPKNTLTRWLQSSGKSRLGVSPTESTDYLGEDAIPPTVSGDGEKPHDPASGSVASDPAPSPESTVVRWEKPSGQVIETNSNPASVATAMRLGWNLL